MDSRLTESGLILTAIGLAVFWLLADLSNQQNSASWYTDSIVLVAVFFVSGLALAASGVVRKGMMRSLHARILLVGSFVIGIVLIWVEWFTMILISRISGPLDCPPYFCDPLFGVPQYFIIVSFLAVGVGTSVVLFLGSLASAPHSTGHARNV